MWPRQLLGYGRLEDAAWVGRICTVYKEVWGPLQNFFLPCLKLKKKWRERSHWHRRYEPARTAYDRLCAPGILTLKERSQLREHYASLDPLNERRTGATIEADSPIGRTLMRLLLPPLARKKATAFDRRGGLGLESSPPCSFYLAIQQPKRYEHP